MMRGISVLNMTITVKQFYLLSALEVESMTMDRLHNICVKFGQLTGWRGY